MSHSNIPSDVEVLRFSPDSLQSILENTSDQPVAMGIIPNAEGNLLTLDFDAFGNIPKIAKLPEAIIDPPFGATEVSKAVARRFHTAGEGQAIGTILIRAISTKGAAPRLHIPVLYRNMPSPTPENLPVGCMKVWRSPQSIIRLIERDDARFVGDGRQRRFLTRVAVMTYLVHQRGV